MLEEVRPERRAIARLLFYCIGVCLLLGCGDSSTSRAQDAGRDTIAPLMDSGPNTSADTGNATTVVGAEFVVYADFVGIIVPRRDDKPLSPDDHKILQAPRNGSLAGDADRLVYRPNVRTGSDTFIVRLDFETGDPIEYRVTITIKGHPIKSFPAIYDVTKINPPKELWYEDLSFEITLDKEPTTGALIGFSIGERRYVCPDFCSPSSVTSDAQVFRFSDDGKTFKPEPRLEFNRDKYGKFLDTSAARGTVSNQQIKLDFQAPQSSFQYTFQLDRAAKTLIDRIGQHTFTSTAAPR